MGLRMAMRSRTLTLRLLSGRAARAAFRSRWRLSGAVCRRKAVVGRMLWRRNMDPAFIWRRIPARQFEHLQLVLGKSRLKLWSVGLAFLIAPETALARRTCMT